MDPQDVILFSTLIAFLAGYLLAGLWLLNPDRRFRLPREPIRRALEIGDLLSRKVTEVTLYGFTPDGNPARVELVTLPWGMAVTVGDKRVSFFPPKCEEVANGIMLLLSGLTDKMTFTSSSIVLTVEGYDDGVSESLAFRLDDGPEEVKVLVSRGIQTWKLTEFLKDHKSAEKLLRELHRIKKAAKALVGALKLIERFEPSQEGG